MGWFGVALLVVALAGYVFIKSHPSGDPGQKSLPAAASVVDSSSVTPPHEQLPDADRGSSTTPSPKQKADEAEILRLRMYGRDIYVEKLKGFSSDSQKLHEKQRQETSDMLDGMDKNMETLDQVRVQLAESFFGKYSADAREVKEIATYERKIRRVASEIPYYVMLCEQTCKRISETWRDWVPGDASGVSVNDIMEIYRWSTDAIKKERTGLQKSMRDLKDPPVKSLEKAYNKIVEVYGLYSQLADLATESPSGSLLSDNLQKSLLTYNEQVSKTTSDLKRATSELSVLVP